jgi:hypothetical protein
MQHVQRSGKGDDQFLSLRIHSPFTMVTLKDELERIRR